MNKKFITIGIVGVLIIFVVIIASIYLKEEVKVGSIFTPKPTEYVCTADAKICPDGSAVGRTGPNCEFTACPAQDATSIHLTTYLGGTATGLNVSVTPKEVVSDSRCPSGVQCIWAGEVKVKTVMSTKVGHGEHVLKIGESQVFGDYTVTLINVTPAPKAGEKIADSSYRFEYEVKKN